MTDANNKSTGRNVSLKSKNTLALWSFCGANLAIFLSLLVSKGFAEGSIDAFWKRVTTKDGIIAASIPILTIVLTGVLNDVAKARLVFWRWRNPLPGCRAFSELLKTDPRIDIAALKKKVGELPRKAAEQNALWYQIYKRHRENLVVSESHRTYLLTRDMAALSATFILLFSIGVMAGSIGWRTVGVYSALLTTQYLLVATSARNYGIRFVLNVLTEESHSR